MRYCGEKLGVWSLQTLTYNIVPPASLEQWPWVSVVQYFAQRLEDAVGRDGLA